MRGLFTFEEAGDEAGGGAGVFPPCYCRTLTFFFDTWMKNICTDVTHRYPIVQELKCANKLMKYQMKQGNVILMIDSFHPIAKFLI